MLKRLDNLFDGDQVLLVLLFFDVRVACTICAIQFVFGSGLDGVLLDRVLEREL